MCLCVYYTFTFSNRTAFRRLDYRLNKLNEELERKCYPQGIVYIVKSCSYSPKKRDRLAYEELVTLAKLGDATIRTEHFHFSGWEEYRKTRKIVGNKDVFGKLWVKIQ